MRDRDMKRLLGQLDKLTPLQRAKVQTALEHPAALSEVLGLIDGQPGAMPACPHCQASRVVRNGQADGLQRYKCTGCAKTFNALTGTPLARLHMKAKWIAQAQVLANGLSVHAAARDLDVARSTAFRWRHRFLQVAQSTKAKVLTGIAEADETFILRSSKGRCPAGRAARRRGGKSATRGTSDEHIPVLVMRDRSGASTDFILQRCDTLQLTAAMTPVLAPDTVLCTDASKAMAGAARRMDVEHQALNLTAGCRVKGPWHIQNVNAYHGRLKGWMRRFNGVATLYLPSYLGWFRALDRSATNPASPATLLALALGHAWHP